MLSGRLAGWGKVIFFCRPSSLQSKVHSFFLGHVFVLSPSLATSVPLSHSPLWPPSPASHMSLSALVLSSSLTICSWTWPYLFPHHPAPGWVAFPPAPCMCAWATPSTQGQQENWDREVRMLKPGDPGHHPALATGSVKSTAVCYMGLSAREDQTHCKTSLPLSLSTVENAYCNHTSPVCPLSLGWTLEFDHILEVLYSPFSLPIPWALCTRLPFFLGHPPILFLSLLIAL